MPAVSIPKTVLVRALPRRGPRPRTSDLRSSPSGYLHDTDSSGIVSTIGAFLPKPYSVADLHAKVGELIP